MRDLQEVYFANLNAVCNMAGFFKPELGVLWSHPLHRFTQNKFYFITKGRCRLKIEGKTFDAAAGDWFFIPANTLHSYTNYPEESFEKYWIHFDLYPDTGLFHILNLPLCIDASSKIVVRRLFSRLTKAYGSSRLTDRIQVKSHLLALIGEYVGLACPEGVSLKSGSDNRIEEILRHIHSNLDRPLTVAELAAEFHLHTNHFIRFFKSKTGQTPARYIKYKKMEAAKRFLEDTDLYITEIMEKIGETDVSSFSKQFKSCYALSPREYRRFFQNTEHM